MARWTILLVAAWFIFKTLYDGRAEIGEAFGALIATRPHYLLVAVLLEVAWTYCLSQVYRSSLVAFGGHAPRRDALRVSMGAFTLSRVLPGGGSVGALLAAKEFIAIGNPASLTLVAMITGGWLSLISLAAIVTAGISIAAGVGALGPGTILLPALILSALAISFVLVGWLLTRGATRRNLSRLLARVFKRWSGDLTDDDLDAQLAELTRVRLRGLLAVGFWTTSSWLLDAAALWVILLSFGADVGVGAVATTYGSANLLQALPELTPGWLGVLESTMAAILAGFGVPAGLAAIAVLSYRMLSFWAPVAAGIPFGLQILHRPGRVSTKKTST